MSKLNAVWNGGYSSAVSRSGVSGLGLYAFVSYVTVGSLSFLEGMESCVIDWPGFLFFTFCSVLFSKDAQG